MVPLYTLSVFRCPSSGIKASLVEAEDFLFRLYKLKDILSTLGTLVWETRDLSHKSVGDGAGATDHQGRKCAFVRNVT